VMNDVCDRFPASAWTAEFKLIARQAKDDEAINPGFGWLPTDWQSQITLKAIPSKRSECAYLTDIASKRHDPAIFKAINEQAAPPNGVFEALLPAFGDPNSGPPKVFTGILMDQLYKLVIQPVFLLKAKYMRARPMHCCDAMEPPMFPPGPPPSLYPGHTSYPSGHACLATSFALVLGSYFPNSASALNDIAKSVGLNREIAGLHFPSDTAAGEDLAHYLNSYLPKKLDPLREDVIAEWK